VLARSPRRLTQQQAFEQSLLRIQSAAAQGRGDEAWREVSAHAGATAPQPARYYETRQQVAIATGHLVDGIPRRSRAERVIARRRAAARRVVRPAARRGERGVSLTRRPGSDADGPRLARGRLRGRDNARNPTLGATAAHAFRSTLSVAPGAGALASEPGVGIEPTRRSSNRRRTSR
jgi:hypothetical protein